MSALHDLGVREAADRIRRRELSSVELVRAALARIAATDRAASAPSSRLPRPRRSPPPRPIDRRIAAGDDAGPLAGVPVGVKDIICTAGVRTTAGSRILERLRRRRTTPPSSARLARRAPSCVGKLNCDEFAMGSSNENSAFGADAQPVGSGRACPAARRAAPARRSRRARCLGDARHRHRRLDPPAGRVLRRRRPQADLRPRVALRRDRLRVVARPGRAARARRRRRARSCSRRSPATTRATRPPSPRPVPAYGDALGERRPRPPPRHCRASTSSRACSPRSTRPCAPAIAELERLGARGRARLAAAHRVRDRHLLPDRHRRGVVEPRPLRRRPLRRCATSGPSGSLRRDVRALARRGLRRRGEAPDHARHLRALRRLLRRVLPEGAAGADADPPRLRAGLRALRRARHAGGARRRPSASARRPTTRSPCTCPTSSPSR